MRSTKSLTASPPSRPSHRKCESLARCALYASAAFSCGVPCQIGSRISSSQSSITNCLESFCRIGALVCLVRNSGDTKTSSKFSAAKKLAKNSACWWPRSVSGGLLILTPSLTHSGSACRRRTISIEALYAVSALRLILGNSKINAACIEGFLKLSLILL